MHLQLPELWVRGNAGSIDACSSVLQRLQCHRVVALHLRHGFPESWKKPVRLLRIGCLVKPTKGDAFRKRLTWS